MESMVPVCDKRYHIYNRFHHFWAEIKKLWNYPLVQTPTHLKICSLLIQDKHVTRDSFSILMFSVVYICHMFLLIYLIYFCIHRFEACSILYCLFCLKILFKLNVLPLSGWPFWIRGIILANSKTCYYIQFYVYIFLF